MAAAAAAGAATPGTAAAEDEVEDLITIVDVPDPNDPEYEEVKTRRRPLTAAQLAYLRPMLQKVGAYTFFCKEFNFADGPAVKEFIHSVEIEGFKPTKSVKVVQEKFTAKVAGRDVVIDAELIERAFGLVDDGENISKPRGDDVNGLHPFYIKPHYVDECQTARGINLNHLRTEYMYFKNLAHQIQAYICGVPEDGFIKLTQYRALDMIVRGKPVNWNRYILQNFQDRIRKYQRSPCPLFFGGTLTALIYQALDVDYQLVNKLPQASPPAPAATLLIQDGEGDEDGGSAGGDEKAVTATPKGRGRSKDTVTPKRTPAAAASRGKVTLAAVTRSSARVSKRKEAAVERPRAGPGPAKRQKSGAGAGPGSGRRKRQEVESEPSVLDNDDTDEETDESEEMTMEEEDDLEEQMASSGLSRRNALLKKLDGASDIPEVLTGSKTYRLSTLYNQAVRTPITRKPPKLTDSKDLWSKYAQYYALGQECHLEHIISKQALEESQRRAEELEAEWENKNQILLERLQHVEELEAAIKAKDAKLVELRAQIQTLKEQQQQQQQQQQQAGAPEEDYLEAHHDQLKPMEVDEIAGGTDGYTGGDYGFDHPADVTIGEHATEQLGGLPEGEQQQRTEGLPDGDGGMLDIGVPVATEAEAEQPMVTEQVATIATETITTETGATTKPIEEVQRDVPPVENHKEDANKEKLSKLKIARHKRSHSF